MKLKGKKPIFSYKDTWSLDHTLSPIISEGLKKFLEVKRSEKSEWFGVPGIAIDEYQKRNNLPRERFSATDEQLKEADKIWEEMLELMIYAFDAKEPDIGDYKFDFDFVDGELKVVGSLEGKSRYDQDMKEHEQKVLEGQELFGRAFKHLWW